MSDRDITEIADDYLLTNVGNLLSAREPKFVEDKKMWIVQIFHVTNFKMGEMTIDNDGNVIVLQLFEDSPEIRQFEKTLRERYPEAFGLSEK